MPFDIVSLLKIIRKRLLQFVGHINRADGIEKQKINIEWTELL